MSRSFKEVFQKFVMFSLTSTAGTIVDLAAHWALANYVFKGNYWGSYWLAPTISFELSCIVNFVIAYYFVWNDRITTRGKRSFMRHFAAYNAAGVGAFMFKFVGMQGFHLLFSQLGWFQGSTSVESLEAVLCNLLGMCFSGLVNFYVNEFLIFNKKKPTEEP